MIASNRPNPVRLFTDQPLRADAGLDLPPAQAHYLANVMRRAPGDDLLLFNGRDGEWRARVQEIGKKRARAVVVAQTRQQMRGCDLHLLFAPLKRARIDYLAQKATEMGADVLQPVMTGRTQVERVNLQRLHANCIEAAEQCNLLSVPKVHAPLTLEAVLADWPAERSILFCDETLPGAGNTTTPAADYLRALPDAVKTAPWAILIGPEGGFDATERAQLAAMSCVHAVSLGPRIMRADTAMVAAMALWQSVLGDWR